MNYQTVSNSTAHVTRAAAGIVSSRLAKLYLDVGRPIETRKIKPGRRKINCTAERRKSLLDCLGATWETISRSHFQAGYSITPEIRKAEKQIENVQANVLEGTASLSDFRRVVKLWEQAVISAGNMNFQETINYMARSTRMN